MGAKVTVIGGGSYQWVPKLVTDFANTPSLHDAEIVIEDIDPAPLPKMIEYIEHVAAVRGIPLRARATTDQRDALDGAEFVIVTISTGGFESMRPDVAVPARYGIVQPVADSVGPGGIMRSQRNVPVFLHLARDMQECCPDAWMLNITNPMTAITRAVARETDVKVVGLCHEVTIFTFVVSLLLDAGFNEIDFDVAGVNHLPFIAAMRVRGDDGFELLRDLVENATTRGAEKTWMPVPDGLGHEKISAGEDWTKADLLRWNRVKWWFLEHFGVIPGAGDRHVAEFFPGFLTEANGQGEQWGVQLTSIEDRERDQRTFVQELDEMIAAPEVSPWPSGEFVAEIIDSMRTGTRARLPFNLPNVGQVPQLPPDVVVESMGIVDGDGLRAGEPVSLPPGPAEFVRRVSASQELTVDAAVTGDRDTLLAAMMADPLAGRLDVGALERMTAEMVAATKRWLPQYA